MDLQAEWMRRGLSTEPVDRPHAEAGVRFAYRQAGLSDAVRMIWTGSPISGACLAESLLARASSRRRFIDRVAALPPRAPGADSSTAAVDHVRQTIDREISRALKSRSLNPGQAQHDAATLDWWWAFSDVCVLTERPLLLNLDEIGRLHASHGPAVTYPDGWSLYAWHGVVVDPTVVQHPERITLAGIKREPNPDIRRVLLERYGWARYVDDSGALPAHADDTGTLYRCDIGCGEPLVLVSVVDEAVGSEQVPARLVLRVPPDITQACQAVEWALMQLEE